MEKELIGFCCPKCNSIKNIATLMKELPEKRLWFATCKICGSQGMIEEIKGKKKGNIIIP
jgi:transcription elongation factor Elf1